MSIEKMDVRQKLKKAMRKRDEIWALNSGVAWKERKILKTI
jgi:hypothetical protein